VEEDIFGTRLNVEWARPRTLMEMMPKSARWEGRKRGNKSWTVEESVGAKPEQWEVQRQRTWSSKRAAEPGVWQRDSGTAPYAQRGKGTTRALQ